MDANRYRTQLVAATSDGAAVNFGHQKGVQTRLKKDREWLLTVHCVSHRLELVMKATIMKFQGKVEKVYDLFRQIVEFMVSLYYYQKKSGKFVRLLKDIAAACGVNLSR